MVGPINTSAQKPEEAGCGSVLGWFCLLHK